MRSIQRLAWLSVMLALSAAAQEETAEVPPEAPPRWSVGGGVGFGFYGISYGVFALGLGYGGGYNSFVPVGATASMEYAVTRRFSVGFGFAGAYAQSEPSPSPVPEQPAPPTQIGYGAAVSIGGRAFLNDGTTRLSLHAFAFGSINESTNPSYPQYDAVVGAWRYGGAGAVAGFAVDHLLLDRVSVRAALGVLGASLSSRRPLTASFRPVPGSEAQTSFSLGAYLSPSFELRLAF